MCAENTIINQIIRFGTFRLHKSDNGPNPLNTLSRSLMAPHPDFAGYILIRPFHANSSVSLSWALSWSWNYREAINTSTDAVMTAAFRAELPQGKHGDGAITSNISPRTSPSWAPGKASADLCWSRSQDNYVSCLKMRMISLRRADKLWTRLSLQNRAWRAPPPWVTLTVRG